MRAEEPVRGALADDDGESGAQSVEGARSEESAGGMSDLLRSLARPDGDLGMLLRPGARVSRYEIVRRLGAGGMGVVYEALDRERGVRVALKTVRRPDASSLYRFKNEYRTLADVTHPNLVTLYDLVSEGRSLFFAMELVDGTDLLSYVRGTDEAGERAPDAMADTLSSVDVSETPEHGAERVVTALEPAVVARVRAAFRQLVEGVSALHAAGRYHRDLKPSNVMVTGAGRVVILDFGLVVEVDAPLMTQRQGCSGTVEYMAPEQAAATALTQASDWYAVGVMLYEALTGVLPYRGPALRIMMDKQQVDPARPGSLTTGVPEDLDALCCALLAREPESRPRSAEILAALGAPPATSKETRRISTPSLSSGPFVGREREAATLRRAFAQCGQRRAVTVHVRGDSGLGKSTLVRRVLDELQSTHGAIVLSGRCYEQEAIPYKAVDSVVDSLSHYLKSLPRERAAAVLPRETHALAKLFPVLRRVEAVAGAPRRPEIRDPQELRRRAFGALRELLERIADRAPLVLWIDDLQWGDADSAALLGELLRPPDPPPMLVVASYRTEIAADNPLIAALQRLKERYASESPCYEIALEPLSIDETRTLVEMLVPEGAPLAEEVAAEAAGNPFLTIELVQYAVSSAAPSSMMGARLRVERMLDERLARLPPNARRLLEIVGVAGRPLARELALAAAELPVEDERPALAVLRAGRLIRTVPSSKLELLDTFHDRIRETMLALLDREALAARHRRLFSAMEASDAPDAEALAAHALGACEPLRAGEWAERAGDRAASSLAFDRASEWYRSALEWQSPPAEHRRQLLRKLADALAGGGRGGDAGRAYTLAAEGATSTEVLELRRRAAQQFLVSGHLDEGIATLRWLLGSIGLGFPASSRAAFWELVAHRARLALFGYRYRVRDSGQIAALTLARADTCLTAGIGLSMSDNIRGHVFGQRFLRLAFEAGEATRIGIALAGQVWTNSISGVRLERKVARLQAMVETIRAASNDDYLTGFSLLMNGHAAYFFGRYAEALELYDRAAAELRQNCIGVAWELDTAAGFAMNALFMLGRTRELCRRVPPTLEEAHQRGDLYLMSSICLGYPNARWLVLDEPARALAEVDEAMARVPTRSLHFYYALIARAQASLYLADGAAAYERVCAEWHEIESGYLLRMAIVFVVSHHLRARAALSLAATGRDVVRLQREALRAARVIEHRPYPPSPAFATSLRAIVAAQRGEHARSAALFADAASVFEQTSLRLFAAAARFRQGELTGGEAGQALIESAEHFMRSEDIRSPARMTEMLMPGTRMAIGALPA